MSHHRERTPGAWTLGATISADELNALDLASDLRATYGGQVAVEPRDPRRLGRNRARALPHAHRPRRMPPLRRALPWLDLPLLQHRASENHHMIARKIVQGFNDVTQIDLGVAYVATLPTGERVELPAGTVLREATPEDAVPPRCTGKRPANAGTTGIECDDYECNVHGRGAIRRLHERVPSEWPTPRAMAEIACRKRTLGQGFQSGFEEGVTTERARFEAAPLVSLDSSWAARYTEAMRVNAIQRAEIERLREQLENSATPADRAVGAAMLGSLR